MADKKSGRIFVILMQIWGSEKTHLLEAYKEKKNAMNRVNELRDIPKEHNKPTSIYWFEEVRVL